MLPCIKLFIGKIEMLMHREILLWYDLPLAAVCTARGLGIMYAMLQLEYLHYYNRRTDGTKVSIKMTHLYWYIFKTPTRKDWVPWVEHTIKLSDVHKRAEWREGTHVCTSAGWSKAPVDCGHVSSSRVTCPRQCEDPEWLSDWTTKEMCCLLSAKWCSCSWPCVCWRSVVPTIHVDGVW